MATEAQLQKLLNRIAKDSGDATDIARQLYGSQAQIFAESDGGLHAMSDDSDGTSRERQSFIKVSATRLHRLGVGAW